MLVGFAYSLDGPDGLRGLTCVSLHATRPALFEEIHDRRDRRETVLVVERFKRMSLSVRRRIL